MIEEWIYTSSFSQLWWVNNQICTLWKLDYVQTVQKIFTKLEFRPLNNLHTLLSSFKFTSGWAWKLTNKVQRVFFLVYSTVKENLLDFWSFNKFCKIFCKKYFCPACWEFCFLNAIDQECMNAFYNSSDDPSNFWKQWTFPKFWIVF